MSGATLGTAGSTGHGLPVVIGRPSHLEALAPFLVMEVMERAQELERSGIDIVHMEVGEPDFDPPARVVEAAARAVADGRTHYTHSMGLPELREAIAAGYARQYGVDFSPDRVLVTTGTSGGLCLLMAALLGAGDQVLLTDPGYACYPNFVRAFHGVPAWLPVAAEEGYRIEPAAVGGALTSRTRALIVNSPANPTGAVQPTEVLQALAELPVALISDEIYHGLEYGETRAESALRCSEDVFVLDGFSKRYAMTGFRLGWLVAPPGWVRVLQKLQQNLFICASSVAQHAGLAALRDAAGDVERMRREYDRRRRLLIDGLRGLGFGLPVEPAGAYYVLVDARHLESDSLHLAFRLLEEARVAVAPGIDFGSRAEGFLRFSFTTSQERIEEGLERLRRWLATRAA
jgi:aspartate/methionine/tyrosine aminotransferase